MASRGVASGYTVSPGPRGAPGDVSWNWHAFGSWGSTGGVAISEQAARGAALAALEARKRPAA